MHCRPTGEGNWVGYRFKLERRDVDLIGVI
jgi:hypothetical protein